MALCVFDIAFTGSATALFERAKAGIQSQGGTLTGDATKGTVSAPTPIGRMAGTYAVTGQVAHFEITEKPFLLSCARIQTELAKLAAQPALAETRAAAPAPRSAKPANPAKRSATPKTRARVARGTKKVGAKKN